MVDDHARVVEDGVVLVGHCAVVATVDKRDDLGAHQGAVDPGHWQGH